MENIFFRFSHTSFGIFAYLSQLSMWSQIKVVMKYMTMWSHCYDSRWLRSITLGIFSRSPSMYPQLPCPTKYWCIFYFYDVKLLSSSFSLKRELSIHWLILLTTISSSLLVDFLTFSCLMGYIIYLFSLILYDNMAIVVIPHEND